MTQGTHGISLAHRAALGCLAVARRLPVVVLVVSIAAFMAGTAGTSYAKKKPVTTSKERRATEQTVVVSNFGSLFQGSIETFAAGSIMTSGPTRFVHGPATLLQAGNGAAGDGQSSLDGDIAVTVPLGVPVLCPNGCVGVWAPGANGNTAPEEFIGGPADTLANTHPVDFGPPIGVVPALNNLTGLFLDQGVAYEDPFFTDGVAATSTAAVTTTDRFAVANFGQAVVGSTQDFEFCGLPTDEDTTPTIGTITEYNAETTGNIAPTPNFPVFEAPFPPNAGALPTPFLSNATIGGCDTALDGPIGLTFDEFGDLWVVNEGLAGLGAGPPGFVTEYAPGAFGDAAPINIIGLLPPTAGAFVNPLYITTTLDGHTIFVTDAGDNSIKVFDTTTFGGTLLGTIKGGNTKLVRPEGIQLLDDDLYVVSNNANSLLMFDLDTPITGGGTFNLFPQVLIKGFPSKMNFPVGVTAPEFVPIVLGATTN
jgi:hypothetical protein